MDTLDVAESYIVYDGECPFCSAYVRLVRLRDAIGKVVLVNAREDHPVVRELKRNGYVLDSEMAFVSGGQVWSGPDCINRLALLSSRSNLFNRMNAALLSSPSASRFAYPVLRALRNASLRILGKGRIASNHF
jgi:predicted DCC family thiol-disulfide oxidoreductase YuxK